MSTMPTLPPGGQAIVDLGPAHEGAQQVQVIPNGQLHSPRIYRNSIHVSTTLEFYTDTKANLSGQGLNAPPRAGMMLVTGLGPGRRYAQGPGGYFIPLITGGGWAWVQEGSPLRPTS